MKRQLGFIAVMVSVAAPLSLASVPPNAEVEARAARELWRLEGQLRSPYTGSETDGALMIIATSLARLGRLETALQTVAHMGNENVGVSYDAPQTRDEVLRISIRRRVAVGNLTGAMELIPTIRVARVRADAEMTVARALMRQGDVETARQHLFRAVALLQKEPSTWPYLAYLLKRNGDVTASQRLFARAERLLPSAKPTNATPGSIEEMQEPWFRDTFANYLFKAGFIDQWLQFTAEKRPFLSANTLHSLFNANRFDVAIRLAQRDKSAGKIANLVFIAVELQRRNGNSAQPLELLREAERAFEKLPEHFSGNNPEFEQQTRLVRNQSAVFLVYGFRVLGDEAAAQRWTTSLTSGQSVEEAASWRVYLALMPLLIARENQESLSPAALGAISAQILADVPHLKSGRDSYGMLRILVEEQIKAGQFEAAQSGLLLLEPQAVAQISGARDSNGLSAAIQVAKFWRQIGDEARTQALLHAILTAPNAPQVTQRDRAHAFVFNGFLEEGRKLLMTLPKAAKDKKFSPSMAAWEATFAPNRFPQSLAQIKIPREHLQALNEFTEALTRPIFEIPGERELELSQNGTSASS